MEAATCGTGAQKERPASFVQRVLEKLSLALLGKRAWWWHQETAVWEHPAGDTSEEGGGHCSCPSWGGPLSSLRPWGVCVRFNDSYLETRLLPEGY